MMTAARKGAVAGLFFGLGTWTGLLLMGNYDFFTRLRRYSR